VKISKNCYLFFQWLHSIPVKWELANTEQSMFFGITANQKGSCQAFRSVFRCGFMPFAYISPRTACPFRRHFDRKNNGTMCSEPECLHRRLRGLSHWTTSELTGSRFRERPGDYLRTVQRYLCTFAVRMQSTTGVSAMAWTSASLYKGGTNGLILDLPSGMAKNLDLGLEVETRESFPRSQVRSLRKKKRTGSGLKHSIA
jgi:hypothetical protein